MTSPISMPKDTKKKFIPKRRAPYLLQDEIIQQTLSNDKSPPPVTEPAKTSHTEEEPQETKKQKEAIKVVNKKSNGSLPKQDKQLDSSQMVVSSSLNYHEEVSKLYGIQKRIAHYFVNCCITRRDVITGPVTAETLCGVANTTKKTLKKILQRMIEKNLIMRVGGKRGKGGFSVFSLEKDFIDVLRLQLDLENNHLPVTQQYNNRQVPTSATGPTLPQEWQDIDFVAVEEIGFGIPQLRQLYNKNVTTPDTIQASINHFSFVLENKPEKLKKYNDKLATFMSVLYKGGAWVDKDYMSPQEVAFQQLAEQKKVRVERFKKMEEEFLKSEFELWESGLTDEEKNKIIPEDVKKSPHAREIQKTLALKSHFKQYLWQEKIPEELKQIKKELQS